MKSDAEGRIQKGECRIPNAEFQCFNAAAKMFLSVTSAFLLLTSAFDSDRVFPTSRLHIHQREIGAFAVIRGSDRNNVLILLGPNL